MKKQIYFISAFFPSFAGGAEKSILEEFKKYSKKGYVIKGITFDSYYKNEDYDFDVISGKNYQLKWFSIIDVSRFFYLFLNRRFIFNILEKDLDDIKKSEFVIIQGPFSPEVADFCIKHKIKYYYYLRDNSSINLFPNYNFGLRKLAKSLKNIFEMSLLSRFKKLNERAIRNADKLIANSDPMADGLYENFGIKADEIIYPHIDISVFKSLKIDKKKQKYITLIGGRDSEKGYDVLLKVAKELPDQKFLVVEKRKDTIEEGNITYTPWKKNVFEVYEISKIVLSISRWSKTFSGRVGPEAAYLKVPVISSSDINYDFVDSKYVYVLKNIDDVNEWVDIIKTIEK